MKKQISLYKELYLIHYGWSGLITLKILLPWKHQSNIANKRKECLLILWRGIANRLGQVGKRHFNIYQCTSFRALTFLYAVFLCL